MITYGERSTSAYKAKLACLTIMVYYAFLVNSIMPTRRNLDDSYRKGFISIDCGATNGYTNPRLEIDFTTDFGFVDTGVNDEISSDATDVGTWKHLSTLRSFPTGTKNCYTLKPEQGKDNKYLIRALFWYGNYDGQDKAPEFDVYIGVNLWSKVRANMTVLEMIYSSSSDIIFICLVRTGAGIPYISSLELRLLDNSIYSSEPQTALLRVRRQDLGKIPDIERMWRYQDDPYDRIWDNVKVFPTNTHRLANASAVKDGNKNNQYRLPGKILMDGIIANATDSSIQIFVDLNPQLYHYIYFHFLELQPNTGKRNFNIYLNDVNYGVVRLNDHLSPKTVIPLSIPIQGVIRVLLNATADSELPPILNAYEAYQVLQLPFIETHEGDVNAVMDIKKAYQIAKDDWQGDPCFPNFIWSGLDCNRSKPPNPPRIVSLNLSYQNLNGSIAPSITNLTALQTLDLSYNSLNGALPEFLWNLTSLKTINLGGNNLSGSIPQFILEKQKNGTLDLSICGNTNLELLMPCKNGTKKKNKTLIITVSAVSILALSVILSVIVFCLWRRRRNTNEGVGVSSGINAIGNSSRDLGFKNKTREFNYAELVSITDNFKDVIGEGGFGKVYHGILKDGSQVAVKLLSASSSQGYKEFRAEVKILTEVRHRNLVSLVGYCDEGQNLALIYEYVANGSLQQHVSDSNKNVLRWKDRLQIAVASTKGIEYLHSGCKAPIIHRDLKPSNILLDEKLRVKIADFGISRMFVNEYDTNVMTTLAGTPSYLDPEYHSTGKLTTRSDVYSFGVILLQLITGKSAIIKRHVNIHITDWVKNFLERGDIESIMDPRLEGGYNINSAWKAVEVATACVSSRAVERVDISYVHSELKECLNIEMCFQNCQEIDVCVAVSGPGAR